eukprot:6470912-Amphidinium_carterae.2
MDGWMDGYITFEGILSWFHSVPQYLGFDEQYLTSYPSIYTHKPSAKIAINRILNCELSETLCPPKLWKFRLAHHCQLHKLPLNALNATRL